MAHEPLFQVFLDMWKAYESLDRGQFMEILRGYGMGKRMARLIAHHWENLIFIPKLKRFLGTPFGTGRGVTQGDPASPIIFNIVVDKVARATLEVVCSPQEARHVMGRAAGDRNLIFYTDDRSIGGRDHIWFQDALTVSVAMFQRMGMETNLENTRALVCTPGYICGKWSEAAYKLRATGEGGNFRERKQARVSCTICGVTVAASSLRVHMVRQH